MLKNSSVNAKTTRPVIAKRVEKPQKTETKHEENKEKPTGSTSKTATVSTTKKATGQQLDVLAKSKLNSKTVVATKSKQATPVAPKQKILSGTATSKTIRPQPMKATHLMQAKKPVVAEKNVMNTIHNLTVSSPPFIRKVQANVEENCDTLPRERTKTRTLRPEEVTLLKQPKRDDEARISSGVPAISSNFDQKPLVVQEPVAFEITFEKAATSPSIEAANIKQPPDASSDDGDYEDDFDSYESDFETESSASSQTASTSSKSESESRSTPESPRVTAAKRLDDDRDFDSGTYELKGSAEKVQLDSIDERELHSEEQNDSGFGYNNTPSPIEPSHLASSNIISKPLVKPIYSKRGMELMKKISLDTMTFTLFELKPLSYDLYMKIYGQKNTNQSSSQTSGNMVDQDAQTDFKSKQSMWTQYPTNFLATDNCHADRIGCGEGIEDIKTIDSGTDECRLENSLKVINRNNIPQDTRHTKPIDYERLNFFLQKSAITMSSLCDANATRRNLQQTDSTFSSGFYRISAEESAILNDTTVYYVYSNPAIKNVVYLAHRQRSTSRTHDNCFVSVWNILEAKKPIRVLSCWSLIVCLEVHHNFQDVVIGGLTDGCVALWNANESTFLLRNSDINAVPPSHVVSPSIDTKPVLFDFGCITSLKSVFPMGHTNDHDNNLTQVCSLHEFGILTIWTILESRALSTSSDFCTERKIDHRSPWNKIQLIQSSIVDLASMNLHKKIRPKSGFEKKKLYFESNLFNDAALRELHDFDAQKHFLDQSESFRCVDLEFYDGIVVATNKSFLIFIATSLHQDSVRRVSIDDSNLLHATKLKSLPDSILVGLTDGSVKVLRMKYPNVRSTSSDKDASNVVSRLHCDETSLSAKSCAIQNIIKEERKFLDDNAVAMDHRQQIHHVIDEPTAALGTRFINNQIVLPAMTSHRDFVRWMDVSATLNSLMSLCGERLRVINFQNSSEDRIEDNSKKICVATIVAGFNRREYLVNFEDDSVIVHQLLQKNR